MEVIKLDNVSAMLKLLNIKERSDGRYEGRVTVNGIRKSFYGTTKSEVKTKVKEYLMKVENGYKEPKKIKLDDYAMYWLTEFKLNKIEPSSYTRLYRTYECLIKNDLGNKMIGDVTTKDIQHLIDNYANPSTDGKALALSGLKRILHFLRPCLNMAVKEEIIYKNPCDDVVLPKESCIEVETKRQFSLSDAELEEFRKAALSKYKSVDEYCSRDAFLLLIIVNLGLRVGEMLALKWDDVDFINRVVHIDKTVQSNIMNLDKKHGDNTTYNRIKNQPKTKSGIRVLKMNNDVLWYFDELQKYDKRNGLHSDYVCCTKAGTLVTSRNLQRSLDRILKKTQINKKVTLHTLRHTFGSTLIRHGVNISVVSKLMGHANITITYNKYIHTIQEEEAKAMESIKVC